MLMKSVTRLYMGYISKNKLGRIFGKFGNVFGKVYKCFWYSWQFFVKLVRFRQ